MIKNSIKLSDSQTIDILSNTKTASHLSFFSSKYIDIKEISLSLNPKGINVNMTDHPIIRQVGLGYLSGLI